jgi:hypothetical protein
VKLVAAMMVGPGELERYLPVTVPALLDFCDEVVIRCEDPAALEYLGPLSGGWPLHVHRAEPGSFFAHEGRARQQLLEQTLSAGATHVLAVDADELVTDPAAVRAACDTDAPGPWTLGMEEVWEACDDRLCVREDGGWRTHEVPCLWRVPPVEAGLRIADRALACGRVPETVDQVARAGTAVRTGSSLLHLGWANAGGRRARYERYAMHDGGRFHASAHLQSIMWPPGLVQLRPRPWPPALESVRAELLAAASV